MKNGALHERGPLTGSTLRRVAEVLGQMGATEVRALAMTRTK
jgi:predicted amidophosphoribosyltransferase